MFNGCVSKCLQLMFCIPNIFLSFVFFQILFLVIVLMFSFLFSSHFILHSNFFPVASPFVHLLFFSLLFIHFSSLYTFLINNNAALLCYYSIFFLSFPFPPLSFLFLLSLFLSLSLHHLFLLLSSWLSLTLHNIHPFLLYAEYIMYISMDL